MIVDFKGGIALAEDNRAVLYPYGFAEKVVSAFLTESIVPNEGCNGQVVRFDNGLVIRLRERVKDLSIVDFAEVEYVVLKLPSDETKPPFVRDIPNTMDQPKEYPYVWVNTGNAQLRPWEFWWKGATRKDIEVAVRSILLQRNIKTDYAIRYARGGDIFIVMPETKIDNQESMKISNLREYSWHAFDWAAKTGEACSLPVSPYVLKSHFSAKSFAQKDFGDTYTLGVSTYYPEGVIATTFTVREYEYGEKRRKTRTRQARAHSEEKPVLSKPSEDALWQGILQREIESAAFALPDFEEPDFGGR